MLFVILNFIFALAITNCHLFVLINLFSISFAVMKAIQYKMSMLLAGFLNGLNFFPTASHDSVSNFSGSLPSKFEISYEDGFSKDAEKLKGDWSLVKSDIRSSFDTLTNEFNEV